MNTYCTVELILLHELITVYICEITYEAVQWLALEFACSLGTPATSIDMQVNW